MAHALIGLAASMLLILTLGTSYKCCCHEHEMDSFGHYFHADTLTCDIPCVEGVYGADIFVQEHCGYTTLDAAKNILTCTSYKGKCYHDSGHRRRTLYFGNTPSSGWTCAGVGTRFEEEECTTDRMINGSFPLSKSVPPLANSTHPASRANDSNGTVQATAFFP
eukprot:Skav208396  [mRNA]  locus=scaffold1179:126285:126776:- [translate_table: standard]